MVSGGHVSFVSKVEGEWDGNSTFFLQEKRNYDGMAISRFCLNGKGVVLGWW